MSAPCRKPPRFHFIKNLLRLERLHYFYLESSTYNPLAGLQLVNGKRTELQLPFKKAACVEYSGNIPPESDIFKPPSKLPL